MTVESVDGDFRVPRVTATETVRDRAPVELAIATVTPETIVLSLQNGVENEMLLASALRLPPLLGAIVRRRQASVPNSGP